jgi:hypothetical protein
MTPKQALRNAEDGARYNLVDVGTINYPLVALAFLQAHYRISSSSRWEVSSRTWVPACGW